MSDWIRSLGRGPWLAVALILALSLGNALRYGDWVANPLVHTDSWYFLDAFVGPWSEGQLDWRHFLLKRDSSDHAQPLHRLALWAHLEWAALDFSIESRLGLLAMGLCLALFLVLCARHLRRHPPADGARWPAAVPLLLLPAFAMSLNSHEIYYWSLVAFFHVALLSALALFAFVCWRMGEPAGRSRSATFALAFALSLIAQMSLDGAGVLAVAALLPVLAHAAWRLGQWRLAAGMGLSILAGLLAYRVGYAVLMPPVATSQIGSLGAALGWITANLSESWQWLLLPASASLAHPQHLPFWMDESLVVPAQYALGGLALLGHGLFWVSVLRDRQPPPLSLFAAALMFLSYGMVAGILLSRLPIFGTDYLLQPRYITFYQLANVALLLQLLVVVARRPAPAAQWQRGVALSALLILGLGLQALLSVRAWEHGVHIRQYTRDMAANLLCLSENPGQASPRCQPGNIICEAVPEHRDRLFQRLREHQLNLHAPGFLASHGLDQGLDRQSCFAVQ